MARTRCFTIYYEPETGEMTKVDESADFKGESALLRADVLRDIVHESLKRYEKAHRKAFRRRMVTAAGEIR